MRFQDRVVIITGAAKGIGAAIAEAFGRERARVAALDIDAAGVETMAKALRERGVDALPFVTDVTVSAQVRAAVDAVVSRWGGVDVLVNNAGGFAAIRLTDEIPEEEWDAILRSNLKSAFLCSQAVLPIMKRQRSVRIVNLASVVGRGGAVRVTSH
jgi:3-oxoacyl-[acyl-carrier protein] reductase